MTKLKTSEEIKAMKNVDMAKVAVVDKSETLVNPHGVVYAKNGGWSWDFYVGDKIEVCCPSTLPTREDARKHCMELMGKAHNFVVKVKEN